VHRERRLLPNANIIDNLVNPDFGLRNRLLDPEVIWIVTKMLFTHMWWLSVVVSTLALFNEVNRHWARLVLGWVTVCGQVNHLGIWPAT